MRVIALDIGERRVGVAVSDPSGRVATPAKALPAASLRDDRTMRDLIREYEADLLLVGLPLSLDGGEGPQAQAVRAEGERLAQRLGIPVDFADERLSSAEVSRSMRDAGLDSRERRGRLDSAAAALFLQTWLDGRRKDNDGDPQET